MRRYTYAEEIRQLQKRVGKLEEEKRALQLALRAEREEKEAAIAAALSVGMERRERRLCGLGPVEYRVDGDTIVYFTRK